MTTMSLFSTRGVFQRYRHLTMTLTCLLLGEPFGPSLLVAFPINREEALAQAYPEASIRAERVFLTQQERKQVIEIAGVNLRSSLVARYEARLGDELVGRAYVDTHTVRTKKESLLICLNVDGSVRRIEVTAFREPPEYQASPAWYRQYHNRALDDELHLNRAIRTVAGATLTAVATNDAVRRVLAIDQVLEGRE